MALPHKERVITGRHIQLENNYRGASTRDETLRLASQQK